MTRIILFLVLFIAAINRAQAAECPNPEHALQSVASIVIETLDETGNIGEGQQRRIEDSQKLATSWFLTQRQMLTIDHVSWGMKLSPYFSSDLVIFQRSLTSKEDVAAMWNEARITKSNRRSPEAVHLVTLKQPVTKANPVKGIRTTPLRDDEPVFAVVYPRSKLHIAHGRFVAHGAFGKQYRERGFALFELSDGENRAIVNHGASGAPVFDCDGLVVGTIAVKLVHTHLSDGTALKHPLIAAKGLPNAAAVPAQAVLDLLRQ